MAREQPRRGSGARVPGESGAGKRRGCFGPRGGRLGAGKGKSRLVYVTVGTGIGGGIILDGQLYRGADMAHPEIGHHVLDPSGPLCSCGFRGCWESLATGSALTEWFKSNAPAEQQYPEDLTA